MDYWEMHLIMSEWDAKTLIPVRLNQFSLFISVP